MELPRIEYPPDNASLRRLVRFCSKTGHIWLGETRMLLVQAASQASLRKELIETLGVERARGLLTRIGFATGVRDAEIAQKLWPNTSMKNAMLMGPQLHMLEGFVRVGARVLDFDIDTGRFYGDFTWENSWEDEAHLSDFGVQAEPVCWGLMGYATGYTTAFMGRMVLWKEIECVASGAQLCRIIGRPADEWEDRDEQLKYFRAESIANQLLELQTQVEELRSTVAERSMQADMIGESPKFLRALELVKKAADSNVTVLLTGETGVGKERFASCLHKASPRVTGPFVAVNCAAIPGELVESELFGVEEGAYTGARKSRPGRFERANGGTLFLDEIGDLPLAAQAKLLRVLQEGEVERLGDTRARKIDVRLVAATNVNLSEAVKAGKFRSDLFYRLSAFPVTIPPLRERKPDIPLLIDSFVKKQSAMHGKRVAGVTDRAMKVMLGYAWPGNVRELENIVERGVILAPAGGQIEVDHLFVDFEDPEPADAAVSARGALKPPEAPRGPADGPDDDPVAGLCDSVLEGAVSLDRLEATLINTAVTRANGNLSSAARMLGITRPQLAYRLKKLS